MNLSDKLIKLRKEKGWSQEYFAEKLDVSRQAISRWENGTALPDAQNILRISKLFHVTADYLLNDDYEDEIGIPSVEISTEETESVVQKKKKTHRWVIPAICCIVLVACVTVIMKVVKHTNDKEPAVCLHSVLNNLKENEIAPSCTAEGSYDTVVYCAECDEELSRTTESVAKIAHTLSNSVKENEVSPSCVAKGSYDEVVYCTKCHDEVLRTHRSTELIAHQFQNRKCIVCNEDQPSEGLLYMSNGDGTCFVDAGDCMDENIVIPAYSPKGEKVTQIKAYAFLGNNTVKSVRIPETVTVIGEGAFRDCVNLEKVNLPSKIKMIHSYTFDGCQKLKEITIPAGVYYIGEEAFADCIACESIVIPASVTKIGKYAFRNFSACNGTVTFEIYDGWRLYDDSGNWIDIDFKNSTLTPTLYITFLRSEYAWKRV